MTPLLKKIIKVFPKRFKKQLPKEAAVINISQARSRILHRTYFKKDTPTNVMSFRYDVNYGEILICPSVIKREAKRDGNTQHYQMTWMMVHGMLHLAGVHHEKSKSAARKFEALEARIIKDTLQNA